MITVETETNISADTSMANNLNEMTVARNSVATANNAAELRQLLPNQKAAGT